MAAAGYSGTPLPQKLGIKAGARVALVDAPDAVAAPLGKDLRALSVTPARALPRGAAAVDVIVQFVTSRRALEAAFPRCQRALDPSGGLWIAWPKKASGVATDVTEDVVRAVALAAGLVDNKVCAIDETWSGLRVVVRLADRPKRR